MSDYTNGEPFIVTHREAVGEFSNAIRFLLPDGTRQYVIIDQAVHTDALERKLGDALAQGRTNQTKKGR